MITTTLHGGKHTVCAASPGRLRLAWAGVMGLSLLTTACTTVGPDFHRPEASVAENWQDIDAPELKTETADHGEWWSVFGDPVLSKLIDAAYEQNLGLRIAAIRILEARAQLGIAVGNLYPQQQQAVGGAIYQSGSENQANTSFGDLSFTNFDI